jgi:hypothetical protein
LADGCLYLSDPPLWVSVWLLFDDLNFKPCHPIRLRIPGSTGLSFARKKNKSVAHILFLFRLRMTDWLGDTGGQPEVV